VCVSLCACVLAERGGVCGAFDDNLDDGTARHFLVSCVVLQIWVLPGGYLRHARDVVVYDCMYACVHVQYYGRYKGPKRKATGEGVLARKAGEWKAKSRAKRVKAKHQYQQQHQRHRSGGQQQ
jgi:hypothetical protein